MAAAGIEPSVGSIGDSYDNALAETVIGLFKTEVIRRRGEVDPNRGTSGTGFLVGNVAAPTSSDL